MLVDLYEGVVKTSTNLVQRPYLVPRSSYRYKRERERNEERGTRVCYGMRILKPLYIDIRERNEERGFAME